ncbi:MAG: AlpA family phage regulatory protein [Pseudomonadota bacterium]
MTEIKLTRRIQAHRVREICGGISDMTLWRWLNTPEMDFPKPIYIGRRRYWREEEVHAWLEAQEVAA